MHSSAICLGCGAICPCEITTDSGVWIERSCACGMKSRSKLYSDPSYYQSALEQTLNVIESKNLSVFFEVTERCDVGCATCSASSVDKGNDMSPKSLANTLKTLNENYVIDTVVISGGEPLLHDDLARIVDESFNFASNVVLITSGVGLSNHESTIEQLAKYGNNLEIFLQFDSFDDEILRTLRSPSITGSLRRSNFYLLRDAGFAVTPVCVVSPMTTKEEIAELTNFAYNEGACGIAFQPIKQVGRTPALSTKYELDLTTDYIQATALKAIGSQQMPKAFPLQPFDLAVNWVGIRPKFGEQKFFGSSEIGKSFRISTCSYWDSSNFVSKLVKSNPYYFAMYTNYDVQPLTSFYLDEKANDEHYPQRINVVQM